MPTVCNSRFPSAEFALKTSAAFIFLYCAFMNTKLERDNCEMVLYPADFKLVIFQFFLSTPIYNRSSRQINLPIGKRTREKVFLTNHSINISET